MRNWRFVALALAVLAADATALGQPVVTSGGPDRVAVTVYRDPQRDLGTPPRLDWLDGYALISETRSVALPAGESIIRFEGVAGGILPQSAIVAGLPDEIVERNRDAYLLSPATLLDASLGRRVHLRRTSEATGEVRDHEAVIRSGAAGAVVLETADGVEALRCTGLRETLVYGEVPVGLASQPTLSIRARAREPVAATVTLSYLATGFDWQADYILDLSDDGRHVSLFAWLTLASTDEVSFRDADTQAVAGVVNWQNVRPEPREGPPLHLRCWPFGRTSDIPLDRWAQQVPPPAPPMAGESIIVTGTRVERQSMASPSAAIVAAQEELGDLKLYRIPEPVTVAANAQKQVALLQQPRVRIDQVYRRRLYVRQGAGEGEWESAVRYLVTRNREREGLGIPLPAGRVALFASASDRSILLGQAVLGDRAVGDDVEIALGPANGVQTRVTQVGDKKAGAEFLLTVANDAPTPVRFEAEFVVDDAAAFRPIRRLARRDGMPLWAVTVPGNGAATLRYRIDD